MALFDPHNGKIRIVREVVRFTPLQQDVVKFLALMLMVFDHANRALSLEEPALMLLGRGAFPLFALVWGYNLANKPVRQAQANRLWMWAIIAQPGYWLVMRHSGLPLTDPNILFVFAVVTQALALMYLPHRKGYPNMQVTGALFLLLWCVYGVTDSTYGVAGVMLLLASYGLCVRLPDYVMYDWPVRGQAMVAWPLLALAINSALGHAMMMAGLLLPALLILSTLPLAALGGSQQRFLPRSFFVQAYVVHLLVLGLAGGILA